MFKQKRICKTEKN